MIKLTSLVCHTFSLTTRTLCGRATRWVTAFYGSIMRPPSLLVRELASLRSEPPLPEFLASFLGSPANAVLGQPDFTSCAPQTRRKGLNAPYGLWVEPGGFLWVADKGNSRVLRYDFVYSKPNGKAWGHI